VSPGRGELRVLPDAEALADAVAEAFAETTAAVAGPVRVALAGGGTPRGAYARLAAPPLRDRVPWSRLHVFFGDERTVPPDHPDSNYGMAREALLARVPVAPERVHRMHGDDPDPEAAAERYTDEIARTFAARPDGPPPRFDLVLLGLGADGHTASLFSDSPALAEERRWVVSAPGPAPGETRITLTPPLLRRAARMWFLVSGAGKTQALRWVRGDADPPPPARLVLADVGELLFFADRAATQGA